MGSNYVTQDRYFSEAKLAFFHIEFDVCLLQMAKDDFQVFKMFSPGVRINEDIIQLHHAKFSKDSSQGVVHQPLEGGGGITKAKVHDIVFIQSFPSGKGSLFLIFWLNFDLPIA